MYVKPFLLAALIGAYGIGTSFALGGISRAICETRAEADAKNARVQAGLEKEKVNDPNSTVQDAASVYSKLTKQYKIPTSLAKESMCVAVFPGVITAALAVGGIHGDGVAFCRGGSDKGWGDPIFLDLTGASVGLQAGFKDADLVMFMKSPGSRAAMERGGTELTGEFAAIAGELNEKFSAPEAGVVVYGQAEGVFAGASLNGVRLTVDKDEERAFYGIYDKNSMWEGKVPPAVRASVEQLREKLPG